MIYVDTNVVMYAVGRPHPLREEARERLIRSPLGSLATSAEVLQELMHAYLPVGRTEDLDNAFKLVNDRMVVWPVTAEDVRHARDMAVTTPSLSARDLLHLAMAARHNTDELWTYDRALKAAAG
ncbi:type II toxin-antitoxin system VapC family toxin [soil metagenome]